MVGYHGGLDFVLLCVGATVLCLMDLLFLDLQGTEDQEAPKAGSPEWDESQDSPSHPSMPRPPLILPGLSVALTAEQLPLWAMFQEHVGSINSKLQSLVSQVDALLVTSEECRSWRTKLSLWLKCHL